MKAVLRNVTNIQGVAAMRETLLSEINNRFDSLQKNDAYVAATFLDPRYKSKFLEPHALQRVKTNLGQVKSWRPFGKKSGRRERSLRQKLQAQALQLLPQALQNQ